MQSIFGALLTAGYATAFAATISQSGQHVSDNVQNELTKSFDGATGRRGAVPAVRGPDRGRREDGVPPGRPMGLPRRDHRRARRGRARRLLLPEEGAGAAAAGGLPGRGLRRSGRRAASRGAGSCVHLNRGSCRHLRRCGMPAPGKWRRRAQPPGTSSVARRSWRCSKRSSPRRGRQRALVLTGGPGVGKTSLWEAGVEAARGRGLRVLRASGSGAETQLSFAALIDLLDGIDLEAIDGLPPPQRQALEVALYRAEAAVAARCIRARPRTAEHAPVASGRPAGSGGGRRPPVARRDLLRCARLRRPAARCGAHRVSARPAPRAVIHAGAGARHTPGQHRGGDALDRRDAPDVVRAARALVAAPRPAPRLRDDAWQPALLARGRADDRRQRGAGADRGRAAAAGRRGLARGAGGAARRACAQADARTRARPRPARVAARRDRRRGRARGRARRGCGHARRRPAAPRASAPGRGGQVRLAGTRPPRSPPEARGRLQ